MNNHLCVQVRINSSYTYVDAYRNFRPPPGGATAYMTISHIEFSTSRSATIVGNYFFDSEMVAAGVYSFDAPAMSDANPHQVLV